MALGCHGKSSGGWKLHSLHCSVKTPGDRAWAPAACYRQQEQVPAVHRLVACISEDLEVHGAMAALTKAALKGNQRLEDLGEDSHSGQMKGHATFVSVAKFL